MGKEAIETTSLFIEVSLFVGRCLDGMAREDADQGAKSVAVLDRREGEGQVLNRLDTLHDDISVFQVACSGGLSVAIVFS